MSATTTVPAPAPAPARRVLGLSPRVAQGGAIAVAVLGAAVALLWPRLARPLGAIALGLALFWVRWRWFRVEGVAGVPFSRASRALLQRKAKAS